MKNNYAYLLTPNRIPVYGAPSGNRVIGDTVLQEKYTSAKGYDFVWESGLCPNELVSSLVVKLQQGECLYVGEERVLTLAPKETVRFYMNDDTNGYANNQGFVKVSWKIVN